MFNIISYYIIFLLQLSTKQNKSHGNQFLEIDFREQKRTATVYNPSRKNNPNKNKEEIKAIQQARRENKDNRAETRLKALELRAKGEEDKDVAKATGFHPAYVTQLVAKYKDRGLVKISGNHYGGNHRNMSK